MIHTNNQNILYEIFCDFNKPINGVIFKAGGTSFLQYYARNDTFSNRIGYTDIYNICNVNHILDLISINHKPKRIQIILIPSNFTEQDRFVKQIEVTNALKHPFQKTFNREQIEEKLQNIFYGFIEKIREIPYRVITQKYADLYEGETTCVQKGVNGFEKIRIYFRSNKKDEIIQHDPPINEIIEEGIKEILEVKSIHKKEIKSENPNLQYFNVKIESILKRIDQHLGSKGFNIQLLTIKEVFAEYTNNQSELIGYDIEIDVSALPVNELISIAETFLPKIRDEFFITIDKNKRIISIPILDMQLKIKDDVLALLFEISNNEPVDEPIILITKNYSTKKELREKLKEWKELNTNHSKESKNRQKGKQNDFIGNINSEKPLVYISQLQNTNIIKIGRIKNWDEKVLYQNYDKNCQELHNPAIPKYYFYTPTTNDKIINDYLYRCCKDVIKKCCKNLKQRKDLGEDFYESDDIPAIIKAVKETLETMTYKELVAIRPKYKRKVFAESKDNLDANIYKPETIIAMINQLDTIDLLITTELNIY